ncbi:hypothetical protein ACFX16_013211 [Malus domestica]
MALWINNINKSTHPTVLQDKAQKPLKIHSSTVHQDQAPKALEDPFINSSSRLSPKALKIRSSNHPSRSSPKALEDLFITVLQDQAQKPLKIRSSPSFKIKPQRPLKKLSTVHPRSSLDGPCINRTSTNTHLTEIESEDQI